MKRAPSQAQVDYKSSLPQIGVPRDSRQDLLSSENKP